MTDTQLHLRWHSHGMTFIGMLHELHIGRAYTDVSLVCDGGVVRAHRAVLSLSSPYLSTVLGTCSENDEAPLLLPEVPVQDIRYLISFIYRGQVDVPQAQIASFLNTGKHLQVLGLEQGDQLVDSPCKSEGSSSPVSDVEEEPNDLENNNDGEKKHNADHKIVAMEMNPSNRDPLETPFKVEDIKIEEDHLDEGRIDLNFYLQQAIQSASMPCPLCKKEFKSQSGLRDHIRLHTGERPFVCDFCHMNFARASHLKRHRRMHTGEKPFECAVCGKDFSRGDKLKDHLRRHEAEDKLQQIRKQILHLEEEPGESHPQASLPQDSPSVSTPLATLAPVSSMAAEGAMSHLLMSKLKSGSQDSAQPPSKRQCIGPKLPLGSAAQFPPAVVPMGGGIVVSQPEGTIGPMLGVTSIGECILRPIN